MTCPVSERACRSLVSRQSLHAYSGSAMLVSLPALGWAGASVWSLLLCFCLPAAALYAACLFLLWRCRFRLRLLSVHCLPASHEWSGSWPLTRWLAAVLLCAPFALLPVAVAALCFVLLAVLPALFASCVAALLLGCAASGALLCYCVARRWQADGVTQYSSRGLCALFACIALSVLPLRLGDSFCWLVVPVRRLQCHAAVASGVPRAAQHTRQRGRRISSAGRSHNRRWAAVCYRCGPTPRARTPPPLPRCPTRG